MKFTLSYKRPLGLLSVLFLLIGCASSPTLSTAQREAYLQQFIGKSSQEIRTQLNLNQIGYQQADAPVLSANRLTYTVASVPLTFQSLWRKTLRWEWGQERSYLYL